MSNLTDRAPIARRTMVLFFIFDTSYSMDGNKIGALNQAIHEVIPMLGDISANNADAEIKIAALKFSSGCEWVFDEPKPADEFIWTDKKTDGMTDLGAACIELNKKLSRKKFLNEVKGSYEPVLILLSDGYPTDDYENGLKKLEQNKWYKAALKFAIAIGNDADKNTLEKFTKSKEAVITVHNVHALKTMIRVVSVNTSEFASKSKAGSSSKQKQAEDAIKNEVNNIDGASTGVDEVDVQIDDEW